MIKVVKRGDYRLVETKDKEKILIFDNKDGYHWFSLNGQKKLEAIDYTPQEEDQLLAASKYRLYFVKDEPRVFPSFHLELSIGQKKWQGYILSDKLSRVKKQKYAIIPTRELITRSCMCCPCEC